MGLLTKLKSLLGFEDDRSQVRRGESGVTIERDPDDSAEPDTTVESAVKGVDADEESTRGPAAGPVSDETDAADTTTPEGIEEADPDRGAAEAGATDETATPEPPAPDEPEAEAVEEAETEAETEPAAPAEDAPGAGEPLEDVKGIGPAYAERLRGAGVEDVADLAAADADRLAGETDLSPKRISRWIERANAR